MDLIYIILLRRISPQTEAYRQVGIYTGKILKGANPTNLPEMRSTV
jgi:hypothetical protein